MIVALAGGVGAARFLDGLVRIICPEDLFVISNTGDDAEIHGFHVSPDIDTVLYTLTGIANRVNGWGIQGDTFHCLDALGRLGAETWFQLGDRDLATHIYRTQRLRSGVPLSTVTAELAKRFGLRATVAPMSNDPVRTVVETRSGALDFQTWFVKRRTRDLVRAVKFQGAARSRPAPGILDAIRRASAIIFCPSNPAISIGPILAVPGIRTAIEQRRSKSVAISPIIAGRALKGPAARMMRSMGMEPTARGVAEHYRGLVDVFVLDREDARLAPAIEQLGMRAVVTNTIMTGAPEKKALARAVLNSLEET